ncbi:hypothetical protein [Paractinoplanes maris]|uniref:hypothetical protein n=1 Tax=Paractinoplanes maris TaxID=1734446 RepID=UPI0020228298|nr:hypothetical protein [Actinoplanes maris]
MPSGHLVITDGGCLEMWSGDRVPDDEERPATDFVIVGPDAEAAGETFERQTGTRLYNIPARAVTEFTATFDDHCRQHGHDAKLRAFEQQVPHRERVRHAVAARDPGPGIHRHGRTGAVDRGAAGPGPAGHRRAWREHTWSLDGLADLVLWGRDQERVAAEFGVSGLGGSTDSSYEWVDLPVEDGIRRGQAIERRRDQPDGPTFAFDFRPHSHHWQVMRLVRAAEHEAGVISVGGADILIAMTSVGDGFFPVHLDVDAEGIPVALRIDIDG